MHDEATVAAAATAAMSPVEFFRDFMGGSLMAQEIFEVIKQTF